MTLVDEYFSSLKKGDFPSFAKFCLIKHGEDQRGVLFDPAIWSSEQKSYYKISKKGKRPEDQRWDVVVKARRIGMTTFGCLQDYFFALRHPGRDIMFVAQDEATRIEGLEIIRNCHENLIEWGENLGVELAPELVLDNVRTLKFANGSRILSEVAKANAVAAKKAGRGKTISRLHCTEVAFWTYAEHTMLSLLEAASKAKEVLIESTPNGSAGWFYDLVQRSEVYKRIPIERRLNRKWRLHFFPWHEHEDYALSQLPHDWDPEPKNKWEKELIEHHNVSEYQLAWWRQKIEDHNLQDILQEYPNDLVSCFRASEQTFLSDEDLQWLASQTAPPVDMEDLHNVSITIWEKPQGHLRYILGCDMGYGRGKDWSVFYIIRSSDAGIVASGAANDVDTATFARVIATMASRYNKALVAVEHQAAGHACIGNLVNQEKYDQLFKHKDKEYYGFNTSTVARLEMFHLIQDFIKERRHIPDTVLVNEFKTVILKKITMGGSNYRKAEAMKGTHDDHVMAYGIALAVWSDVPILENTGYLSVSKQSSASAIDGQGITRLGKKGTGYL